MDFQAVSTFIIIVVSVFSCLFLALRFAATTNHLEEQLHRTRQLLQKTRDAQKLMEMVLQHANDGIVIQDIDGRVEWVNPAYERLTGYTLEEMHNRRPQEFVVSDDDKPSPEEIANFKYDISDDSLKSYEIVRNVRKNGEAFWNQLSFSAVEYGGDSEVKIIVNTRDVTEQIENEERLKQTKADIQKRAEHDVLTGLPNRLKFESFLADELEKTGTSTGILHIDLDRFKTVNDTLGHAAGDAVLTHMASVLKSAVRKNDLPCRIGGDEFIVVCPDAEGFTQLEKIAQRIVTKLEVPLQWNDRAIGLGCSIGIALSDKETINSEELIKNADIALYEVKRNGRGTVASFNRELGDAHSEQLTLSSEIKRALAENQLCVFLQPQFNLKTASVTGFEALIRWDHPRRGLLAPGSFFHVAENNGLMADIDHVAMRGALDGLRHLHDAGFADMRVSMNVSGLMLNQDNYVDMLKWEVDKRGLSPENIAIEVLETTLIESGDAAAAVCIKALSQAGFEVELDDFGTGYAGLYHLSQLDIHGIKIDRSMIGGLPTDDTGQTVFGAIMSLCRELDLQVIAEGVEDVVQADYLRGADCEIIQGYGVARPMPINQVVDWLSTTDMTAILSSSATGTPKRRARG